MQGTDSPRLGDDRLALASLRGGLGDLDRDLKKAALAETGGADVNAMERDGENGATTYEVEVVKADGSHVDVRLDDQLNVVAVDADGEHE